MDFPWFRGNDETLSTGGARAESGGGLPLGLAENT